MRVLVLIACLFATPALAGEAETLCASNPAFSPSIMLAVVQSQLAHDHDAALDADTPENLARQAAAQGIAECAADLHADPTIATAFAGLDGKDRETAWDAYNTACADRHAGRGACITAEIGASRALRHMMATDTPPGAKALVQTCELVMQSDPAMAEWRACVDHALAVHASADAARRCKVSASWHVARTGTEAGQVVADCLRSLGRHLEASLLTTDDAVRALAPEWTALWRSAGVATPFQSPLWLLPWWRQWGTGAPRVAVLRAADGRLAGVLPLYLQREATQTKLLPFGVGITDYTDALLAPDAPAAACALLLATALDGAPPCVCDLPDLPPDAALWQAPAPDGWSAASWTGAPCPVVVLPDSMAALLAGVSRGTRRYLQQAELRAGNHAVTLDRAGPAQADAALTALFDLHTRRWQGRGEAGVLADPRVQAFHRDAAPGLIAAGALRLEVLRLDGSPAAAHFSFLAPGRLLHYVTGFDPALEWARPGTLLLGRLMADAIAEGRRELHFLRGAEAYKYAWGGVDRLNMGRHLTRRA